MGVDVTKYGIGTDLFHKEMVGVRGFEPPASASRTQRATPALHPDSPRGVPASQSELGFGQG